MKRIFPGMFIFLLLAASCGKDKADGLIAPYFFDSDCEVTAPEKATGFAEGCFFTLFEDPFNNNDNNWGVGNDNNRSQEIENGHLGLATEGSASSVWGVSQEIPAFSNLENFEISVSFRIVSTQPGFEDAHSSILWGAEKDGNTFTQYQGFRYNKLNQYYFLERDDPSTEEFFANTLPSGAFASNAWNHFAIRAYEGVWYYFLNQQLVFSTTPKTLFGDFLYLGAAPGNEVWIDEVRVSRILE